MNKAVLGMIAVGLLSAGQVIEFRVSERYDGFTAMYDEFDMDRPYPIREADLLDTGKDIT